MPASHYVYEDSQTREVRDWTNFLATKDLHSSATTGPSTMRKSPRVMDFLSSSGRPRFLDAPPAPGGKWAAETAPDVEARRGLPGDGPIERQMPRHIVHGSRSLLAIPRTL